jgi:hypothetical protein
MKEKGDSSMSLTEPHPPHAVSLAYATGIAKFLKPGDPSLTDTHPGHQHAGQVFVLGLDDLSKGMELKNAPSLGWRFLTGARSGSALIAEVLAAGPDGQPKLTGVSRGPGVTRTLHASQDVRKLPEGEGRELQVLAIPGLLTEAFWLKAIPGKSNDDFVVPFLTTAKELLVMHPYEAGKFLAIAQELANKRLAAKDLAPKPPKPEPAPNTQVRTATTSGQ